MIHGSRFSQPARHRARPRSAVERITARWHNMAGLGHLRIRGDSSSFYEFHGTAQSSGMRLGELAGLLVQRGRRVGPGRQSAGNVSAKDPSHAGPTLPRMSWPDAVRGRIATRSKDIGTGGGQSRYGDTPGQCRKQSARPVPDWKK